MAEEEREDKAIEPEETVAESEATPEPEAPESPDEELESAEPEACEALDDNTAKIACLEEQVAETEQKAAEYLNGWQRTQANFENYRKRTESERVNLRKAANAALLARLLPVLDDFTRAFQSMPESLTENSWIEGLRLIQRKVNAILESEDVQPIALEPGDPFDPNVHQAVLHQETEGFEEGQIVTEVEQGYTLGNRVLRPSMVVVAKSPPPPPDEADAPEDEEEVVEAEVVEVEEEVEPVDEPAEESGYAASDETPDDNA